MDDPSSLPLVLSPSLRDLHLGDTLDWLKALPDTLVDLTVTSPPYNLGIDYKGSSGDSKTHQDYLAWCRLWLTELWRVTKDDGRLCLNVPLDTAGRQSPYADFVNLAREVGWKYRTTVVWNEGNVTRRTAWGSFISASAPNIISPVEMIPVFYKKDWKKHTKGTTNIEKQNFIDWVLGLWSFSGEKKKKVGGHPAAFPEELPTRCIKLFSYEGDMVCDPFMGSGTTLAVAKRLHRRYMGCELSAEYHAFAQARVRDTQPLVPMPPVPT